MSSLEERQWAFVERVAHSVVPEYEGLDAEGRARFRAIIDDALGRRPAGVRRQLGVFLTVLRLAPIVRFGAPLDRLAPGRCERVLQWFQECPVSLLRKGFWGLKALIFMGYYAQSETAPRINYTPSFDGNAHLGHA